MLVFVSQSVSVGHTLLYFSSSRIATEEVLSSSQSCSWDLKKPRRVRKVRRALEGTTQSKFTAIMLVTLFQRRGQNQGEI